MPATQAETRRLARLIAKQRSIQRALAEAAATEAPVAPLLVQFDAVTAELTTLQVQIIGRGLATQWSRDKALKEAAKLQAKAGRRIMTSVMQAADVVKAKAGGDIGALQKAIRAQFAKIARETESQIRSTALHVGVLADTQARAMAVAAFGGDVFGKAASMLKVQFGGGLGKGSVDAIWGQLSKNYLKGLGANQSKLMKAARSMVSAGTDARKAFERLQAAGFPEAQTTKWVKELRDAARAAAADGGPAARAGFDAAARRAHRVSAMTRTKTGRIGMRGTNKKIIADLKKAVGEADTVAIDRAIERYLERRTAYQATSTMRTVTNESYRKAMALHCKESPWIYAERRVLSTGHTGLDECDGIVSNDIGLGAGVYPIGDLPLEHHAGLCVAAETPISTPCGQVPVESVRVGDAVFTHRGRARRVLQTHVRPIRDGERLLELVLRVGSSRIRRLEITEGHPVLTDRGWIPVGALRTGTRVRAQRRVIAQAEVPAACGTHDRAQQDSDETERTQDGTTSRSELCGASQDGPTDRRIVNARTTWSERIANLLRSATGTRADSLQPASSEAAFPVSASSRAASRCGTGPSSSASAHSCGLSLAVEKTARRNLRKRGGGRAIGAASPLQRAGDSEARYRIPTNTFCSSDNSARTACRIEGNRGWRLFYDRSIRMLDSILRSMFSWLGSGVGTSERRRCKCGCCAQRARLHDTQRHRIGGRGSIEEHRIERKVNSAYAESTTELMWGVVVSLEASARDALVYNFEVEEDHSYIAGGILTHNCREEPVIDKGFWQNDGKVLGFKTPPGYAAQRDSLGSGGSLAKQLNKLGRTKGATRAQMKALLPGKGKAIPLTRGASAFKDLGK